MRIESPLCPVREDVSSRPLSVVMNADSGEKTWLTTAYIMADWGFTFLAKMVEMARQMEGF